MNDSKSHIRVPGDFGSRRDEDGPVAEQGTSVFVVVDIWHVKPGKHDELRQALTESGARFRSMPGILSVDYTMLDGDPDRYLVVFRYSDAAARAAFVATDELKTTMNTLVELRDLESPIFKGVPAGF
jgi:heme-degrading monooxygenase HmoA